MQLGPWQLRNPWILAPMAGVSELPYRRLVLQMGASAAPTELVSAKGLLHAQQRTLRYLAHDPGIEKPFWVQIFGGDAAVMAAGAARAVALGADIVDINMGCPVKKVTKTKAGSALLVDPERAAAIVGAVVRGCTVPVTVKIRAGWDSDHVNFVELAQALSDAGAAAIAMHARTRMQGYSGEASWAWIAELVNTVSIPVIGNGDALTAAEARQMLRQTGCAAVMIGRGALGNPWIFRALSEPQAPAPTPSERWAVVRRHFEDHLDFIGEPLRAVRRFRQHLRWYIHDLQDAAAFWQRVNQLEDVDALLEACATFFRCAEPRAVTLRSAMPFDERAALG